MLQIYEASVTGSTKFKAIGQKLVSTMKIQGALSEALAKELGNGELYKKNGTLTEFTSHGFDHDIEAADVTLFGMPGTPGENDSLLHLPSCSVKNFVAAKLDGTGATITFDVTTDILAKAIVGFLDDVRGWNGRVDIQELQQELPMEGEAPADLPKPPAKRGRGAQPKPADEEEKSVAAVEDLAAGAADVKPTKSGKARLIPRKPGGGEKRGPGRSKKNL
jgi:hypothetical protein